MEAIALSFLRRLERDPLMFFLTAVCVGGILFAAWTWGNFHARKREEERRTEADRELFSLHIQTRKIRSGSAGIFI